MMLCSLIGRDWYFVIPNVLRRFSTATNGSTISCTQGTLQLRVARWANLSKTSSPSRYTSIPVYPRNVFLTCSTLTLLDNRPVFKASQITRLSMLFRVSRSWHGIRSSMIYLLFSYHPHFIVLTFSTCLIHSHFSFFLFAILRFNVERFKSSKLFIFLSSSYECCYVYVSYSLFKSSFGYHFQFGVQFVFLCPLLFVVISIYLCVLIFHVI